MHRFPAGAIIRTTPDSIDSDYPALPEAFVNSLLGSIVVEVAWMVECARKKLKQEPATPLFEYPPGVNSFPRDFGIPSRKDTLCLSQPNQMGRDQSGQEIEDDHLAIALIIS
ncbi:hypothetical protein C1H46_029500 [Malus baccata]|uniref:Uncharacterized protein n=1 Tax=Malus baccata TaxID=106549 RepID=A0A540LEV3_MALBA|nr:hypothetical protein C1H46_029500 [Malus baccata]